MGRKSFEFWFHLVRELAVVVFVFISGSISIVTVHAQQVEVYVSSHAGDRLSVKDPMRFGSKLQTGPGPEAVFRVNEGVKHQTILGFGASFLEAGMVCLNSLPAAAQESVLRALFDRVDGAGFSAMKTVIASTDFMSAGPWYSYDEMPDDVEMKHFTIKRDLESNGLITYIKRARKYGNFILQAPMDYPPDWMLMDVEKNQDVNPKYYDALALYYLRYLQEYNRAGVFVDYISLFNEPLSYTKIPYAEIRELLQKHVGPLFASRGIKTRIQASEDPTRAGASNRYPTVLDDPEARKYVAALPYHGYDFTRLKTIPTRQNGYNFQEFEKIVELHKRFPQLPLWMTEVCYWNKGTPWAMPLPRYDYEDSDFWVNQIASDLVAGAAGWTYWNMILDQGGGPWLVSPIHGDGDGNAQQPVVIIDRGTGKVSFTGVYYAIAHFSKFVRPGSVRLGSAGTADGVRFVAFRRADQHLVVELVNSQKTDVSVEIDWRGRSLERILPETSITTLVWPGD